MRRDVPAKEGTDVLAQPMRVIVPAGCGKLEKTFVASFQRELMASHFVPYQVGADRPGDLGVLVRIAAGAQRSLIGLVDGACLDEREGYRHREIFGDDRFKIVLVDPLPERVVRKTLADPSAQLLDDNGRCLT